MSANTFYLSLEQTSFNADPLRATTTQKTWSALSAEEGAKYWSFKATEISMESGAPDQSVLEASSSSLSPTGISQTLSSSSCLSSSTNAEEREGAKTEVKLPKNAVELIAWAITECNTTTPTLAQIATHIQAHVSTYRDEELSVLIKMVQHHLNRNNPTFFLPVMSPGGHLPHNPNLARWAINRQVVTVGEDGSLIRRRHRPHAYTGKRCLSSPSPFAAASRPAPLVVSPPDGASSGSGHKPPFGSFPGSRADSLFSSPGLMGPPLSTMAQTCGGGPPTLGDPLSHLTLFGSASPVGTTTTPLPSGQPPCVGGAGLFGVPVSVSAGGVGTPLPPMSSAPGGATTFQLPLC